MNLSTLSKPQWDAALIAAKCLETLNPNNPADRARFRDAKASFDQLLPEGADARELIEQVVRWDMRNRIAAIETGVMA